MMEIRFPMIGTVQWVLLAGLLMWLPLAVARGDDINIPRPRGLFVLDGRAGTQIDGVSMRDANISTESFVDGYVLRAQWQVLEPAEGVYSFDMITNIIGRLQPLDQKLSLIIKAVEPTYIAAEPGVLTWYDDGEERDRAAPWDPYLIERWEALVAALAALEIDGIPFGVHPVLEVVNPTLPGGVNGIRDPKPPFLSEISGYTRSNMFMAVQTNLHTVTQAFPGKFVQIGFWTFDDSEGGPEAWEDLRQTLLAEFDGIQNPRVGFWMENLAASRPAPGEDPVAGLPSTTFGAALYLSRNDTWVSFQSLGSWSRPFNPAHVPKLLNATPADGMQYAFETYGCTYFEIYNADAGDADFHSGLQEWHDRLNPTNMVASIEVSGVATETRFTWERAAPQTHIEFTSDLTEPFAFFAAVTNGFEWVFSPTSFPAFFRLRQ